MNEQQRLGISDETMKSMKQFFLKTSVPRLIEKKRKEKRKCTGSTNTQVS